MKLNFLYQITAASRTPDWGATAPTSPFSLSSTKFVEPPPPGKKFLGTPLYISQTVLKAISKGNVMM
jgi:hypothetical protein